jgi:hypothetical protein
MSDNRSKTKVIITKYAFSSGVKIAEGVDHTGDPNLSPSSTMFVARGTGFISTDYYHGKDWHKTKESAVAHLNEQVMKKRKSLEKQLAGLDKKLKKALAAIEAADLTPPAPGA